MKSISLFICLLVGFSSFAQDYLDETTSYFDQYLTSKAQFKLLEVSFPTLNDCKKVFEGKNARIYYERIQKIKNEITEIQSTIDLEVYVKSSVKSFSSNDAKSLDGRFSYGMDRIKEVLRPDITFYLIYYTDKHGWRSRYSPLKFFVNLDGKWVFFPKPTVVF